MYPWAALRLYGDFQEHQNLRMRLQFENSVNMYLQIAFLKEQANRSNVCECENYPVLLISLFSSKSSLGFSTIF